MEGYSKLQSYSNWGRDCWCKPGESDTCGKRFEQDFDNLPKGYDHKYIFSKVGYNMKMTDLQAALGTSQMHRNKIHCKCEKVEPYLSEKAIYRKFPYSKICLHYFVVQSYLLHLDYLSW